MTLSSIFAEESQLLIVLTYNAFTHMQGSRGKRCSQR